MTTIEIKAEKVVKAATLAIEECDKKVTSYPEICTDKYQAIERHSWVCYGYEIYMIHQAASVCDGLMCLSMEDFKKIHKYF